MGATGMDVCCSDIVKPESHQIILKRQLEERATFLVPRCSGTRKWIRINELKRGDGDFLLEILIIVILKTNENCQLFLFLEASDIEFV
jgi:hypothetical protein